MSLPSRRDPDMALADEVAGMMLADDAEGESLHGWRSRALGTTLADAMSEASEVRYIGVKVTPRLAHVISRIADDHDMSRDTFVRTLLARHAAQSTGIDFDTLMGDIPRTKGRRAAGKGARLRD